MFINIPSNVQFIISTFYNNNYEAFIKAMKKQYRLNPTDKISDVLDNIDLLSTVIQTIK